MNPYNSAPGGSGYSDGRSGGSARGYSSESQYNPSRAPLGYGYSGYGSDQQGGGAPPPNYAPSSAPSHAPQQHGGAGDDYRRSNSVYTHPPAHSYVSGKEGGSLEGNGRTHPSAAGNGGYGYAVGEGYNGHPTPPAPASTSQADPYAAYQQQSYYYQQPQHVQQQHHQQQQQQQQQQQGQNQEAAAYYANYYYQTPPNGMMGVDVAGGGAGGSYGLMQGYSQFQRGGRGGRGAYPPSSRYGQGGEDYSQGGIPRQLAFRGAAVRGGGYRGGRGGQYSSVRPPPLSRTEQHCILYVDSFSSLHSACRRGTISSFFPQRLLALANGGMGGNPRYSQNYAPYNQSPNPARNLNSICALIIVEKRYLAATISVPKEAHNIVLSENVARKFLDMKYVLNENSQLLLDLAHGSKLPKSLYHQLRSGLVQLLAVDKSETMAPATGEDGANDAVTNTVAEQEMAALLENPDSVFEFNAEKLMEYLLSRYSMVTLVENCLKEESERSTALFGRLLEQSCKWVPPRGGAGAMTQSEGGEEDEDDEGEQEDSSSATRGTGGDGNSSSTTSHPSSKTERVMTLRRRAHPLLRTPHGVFLLSLALENPSKRALFFHRMQEEQEQISRSPYHTAPDSSLFVTFFASILTSPLVFKCFGVSCTGSLPEDQRWPDQESVVQIMCARMANEGIVLVRSTGGGSVLTALLHAQRPQYTYMHPPGSPYRSREGGPGGALGEESYHTTVAGGARKRGREDELDDESPRQDRSLMARKEGRGENSGPGGERGFHPEDKDASSTVAVIPYPPASLQEYEVPLPPVDWRLLEATVEAFCTGRLPEKVVNPQAVGVQGSFGSARGRGRGRGRGNGNNFSPGGNSADAAAGMVPLYTPMTMVAKDISLDYRLPLLTDHVISCRALQTVLPQMADAVLAYEKEEQARLSHDADTQSSANSPSEMPVFARNSANFLESIVKRGKELIVQPFGNYVAQTFLTELSPRAIPNTRIEAYVKGIFQLVQNSFLEFCVDKCASNVLDRAIVTSNSLSREGNVFLLQLLRVLVQASDSQMLNVVSNQYGNYVVNHLLRQISELQQVNNAAGRSTSRGAELPAAFREQAAQVEKDFANKVRPHIPQLTSSIFASGLIKWVSVYDSR